MAGDSKTLATMQPTAAAPRIYSVPRRYDLATLFAISLAYALLFGAMQALGFEPLVFAIFAGFVTVVGAAQAVLFRGKAPRMASIVAGIACWGGGLLAVQIAFRSSFFIIYSTLFTIFLGVVFGYVAGVLVGAVFLIAELVRKLAWLFVRT